MSIHIETNPLKTLISSEVHSVAKGRYVKSSCCIGEVDGIVVCVTFEPVEIAERDSGYSTEHNLGYVKVNGSYE